MTRDVVKKFFYTLSLNELNLMNHNQLCPDVSYNTLLYLDLIYFIPDCTASKIAQQLHISKPAVTSKINDMIAQGLVKKVQSQKDKRVYYLTFNDQVAKAYENYNRSLCRAVSLAEQELSQEEIDIFCRVLEKIGEKYMEDINHEQPDCKKI